jgi:hypothetical protein
MGLDITAYSNLKQVNAPLDIEDAYDNDELIMAYSYPKLEKISPFTVNDRQTWLERTDSTGTEDFRAGSYGGYNAWRKWLCETFIGVSPEKVWKTPDKYENEPFFSLINYSDCEGSFGPDVSQKLFNDFKDNLSELDHIDENEQMLGYDKRLYIEWMNAFELASENGVVILH